MLPFRQVIFECQVNKGWMGVRFVQTYGDHGDSLVQVRWESEVIDTILLHASEWYMDNVSNLYVHVYIVLGKDGKVDW